MKKLTLQQKRRILGWSQFKCAAVTGIDRSLLSQMENGHIKASDPRAKRFHDALDRALTKHTLHLYNRLQGDARLRSEETTERPEAA
jgi:transcriptional regulator with XRE-family HTH domain